METFTGAKPFVNDSYFEKKREEALIKLESEFKSGHCFTIQSCYGQFQRLSIGLPIWHFVFKIMNWVESYLTILRQSLR